MQIKRRNSRKIILRGKDIGGDSPISIQSMTNTDTADVNKTVRQIKRLEQAGCEIVRVAVLNEQSAKAIEQIKSKINIPLAADIHFDYRLAVLSIESGADKIRLNPGNIPKRAHVEKVIEIAKKYKVPIRIGLNSGSVKRSQKKNIVEDMINAGLLYARIFEEVNFDQIIFSLKTHNVVTTIEAYRQMAALTDAPLHLGVTSAGSLQNGIVKASIGIGVLLLEGIGDTIRVSLTSDPVHEIAAAKKILMAVGIRNSGIDIISCPTCGRCTIDLIRIVQKAEKELAHLEQYFTRKKITVAIMGCVVNGPGEAKDADIGIAWGGRQGILFKKGKKIKLVNEKELIKILVSEVKNEVVGNPITYA